MNERWEAFDRIWAKGKTHKMVQRLKEKCVMRGLEPTEENCRDYWMGYIRYYVDGWSGKGYHVNPRKNKQLMKKLKRNKNGKGRYNQSGKKPSRKMGRRNSQKK